ncbi:hypothetical protein CHUAL_007952 [Chamberlinius hualienensis]
MFNYYLRLAVAFNFLSLAFTASVPVPDGKEFVREIMKQHKENQIPSALLEEILRNNVPAKINVIKPTTDVEKIVIDGVKSVDPNAVTDLVLETVDKSIEESGVDPYTVTDFHFLIFTIQLTIGHFGNLKRSGEAKVIVHDPYNYEFLSPVQVTGLQGNFSFSFRFLGIHYDAGVDIKVSTADADVDFSVSVNPKTQQTYIHVTSLRAVDIGLMTFDIHGLGPFNDWANLIANVFLNLFKSIIPLFFNGIFRSIINQILYSLYPPW